MSCSVSLSCFFSFLSSDSRKNEAALRSRFSRSNLVAHCNSLIIVFQRRFVRKEKRSPVSQTFFDNVSRLYRSITCFVRDRRVRYLNKYII